MTLHALLVHLILPLAIAIAGLALFAWGRRGRRVDDHPICRKCGFDLFGLPPSSCKCSECGAEVRRRRALRRGTRVRRGRLALVGVLIFLAGFTWTGMVGWSKGKKVKWIHEEPVFWLQRMARGRDTIGRNAAIDELVHRLDQKQLSASQINSIAQQALAQQADRSARFIEEWGWWIEDADESNLLTREQWSTYLRNAFVITALRVRPRAARSEELGFDFTFEVRAASLLHNIGCDTKRSSLVISLPAGAHVALADLPQSDEGKSGSYAAAVPLKPPFLPTAARGKQTLKATLVIILDDSVSYSPDDKRVTEWTQEIQADWQLLPDGRPSVSLVSDANQATAMTAAVTTDPGEPATYQGNPAHFSCVPLDFQAPPISICARALARVNGREFPLDERLVVRSGETCCRLIDISSNKIKGQPATCDIILRPDVSAAWRTAEIVQIWGRDIVLPNVKLNWPDKN